MPTYQFSIIIFIYHAGTAADIHYGTGAISGYFSKDHVKVGDLAVMNQVIVDLVLCMCLCSDNL